MTDSVEQRPFLRILLFRICSIGFGLGLLLCIEGLLRLTGLGETADTGDPFVGFSDVVPLFVPSEDFERFETSPARSDFFRPDWFRAEKPDKEFRIFCFGGSTVQGRPYAIETSFTRWLELTLRAADPDREWRAVNCGGISYASYRLIPILQETLDYEPDMFVIYTGHNEFLEERSYEEVKQQPAWMRAAHERAIGWRIYGVARSLLRPEPKEVRKTDLPAEVDALLDYQGGLAKYHRDDTWTKGVIEHYELNLRRMIRLAKTAGVPTVLANPVSDIRDTPPFKAEIDSRLSDAERAKFEQAWEDAKQASWDDLDTKLETIQIAAKIDPRHAEVQFLLAKAFEAAGQGAAAKQAYCRAKDEDICPLRMTEDMHDAVRRVAAQTGTPLIDVRAHFESKSETGALGDDEMIDHVHPHIEGHQWIAELLFDHMVDAGIVGKQPGWEERMNLSFKENYTLLPDNYFPMALSRLEGLNNWARGRVAKLRPKTLEELAREKEEAEEAINVRP